MGNDPFVCCNRKKRERWDFCFIPLTCDLPQLDLLPFIRELGEAEGAIEEAAKERGFLRLLFLYYGVLHFDPFVYQAQQTRNLLLLGKGRKGYENILKM